MCMCICTVEPSSTAGRWDHHGVIQHHSDIIRCCPQVTRYGPQFMFTISGVDSLEDKLQKAQEEMGVPPSGWVPINYKGQSDTL